MNATLRPSPDAQSQRPLLTAREREAIGRSPWFAALTPSLRHDILRLGREGIVRTTENAVLAANYLRKKLEAGGVKIATVRGLGYCLERPHAE
mgnify:CR=1 FL=1